MKSTCFRIVVMVAVLSAPLAARAQQLEDPAEAARFRWGPIRFTPTLEITSAGHDSNVFNQAQDPKSDFTAAIGPAVHLWVRPFGSRLSVKTGGQYLYFRKYDDQRGWNTNNEAKWEIPLARLIPFVGGTLVNSRERQGYEIDARSRRRDHSYTVGTRLRVSAKTELVGSVRRAEMTYDDRETFFGSVLANALNRREETANAQFRYALTPLTTFVTDIDLRRDRFERGNVRDSDSLKVLPGFELKPFALISGSVFVGYRKFEPLEENLAGYAGVIAAVKARYTYSATRLEMNVDRDAAYSFEQAQPYYIVLDYGLTITQRVTSRWDLVAQGSRQRLEYRSLSGDSVDAATRGQVDRGGVYGGGLAYRLNDTVKIGFTVLRADRASSANQRSFEGTRAFGSISYGTQR